MTDLADRIRADAEGPVARLTIDRAEKRNAMALAMWTRMAEVLEAWADDPAVRVVVVTGAGDTCFCAGNDIAEFETLRGDAAGARAYERTTERAYLALRDFPRPTIAMIRGVCVGGGLEIAQMCDLQVAGASAAFGVTPARLGLGYKLSDVMLLTGAVAAKHAKEMLFTGDLFAAETALRWGLVNRVVADADLEAAVAALAERIAANAPLSVRAAKVAVGEAVKETALRDTARCESLVDACNDSQDYAEGRRAFAEKRPPQFKGR